MDVTTKILVAYESVSSNTLRLTPHDIASTVAAIPNDALEGFFRKVFDDLTLFGTDERRAFFESEISDGIVRMKRGRGR